MLEDLMLLEGGRLAYFGTTQRARCFFDALAGECPLVVNPAGGYARVESPSGGSGYARRRWAPFAPAGEGKPGAREHELLLSA